METTNSSENQQRRVEDRKPNETINWEAPGAPAVPLSLAAVERPNPPIRYVASLLVNSEGASVFTTPDAARLPHGHYLLSAGAHPIAPGSAVTSGDAPADGYSQYATSCRDRGVLPCSRESFEADQASTSRPVATSGDAQDLLFRAKVCDLVHLLPWDINFAEGDRATGEQVLDDVRRMLRDPAARIERAAAPAPKPVNLEAAPEGEQEWSKVDPATAFHLIERHADNWADAGRMMLAWRDANPAPATASGDELPVERINEIGLGLRIQAFENAAYRAARGQAMTEPEKAEHAGLVAFARAAVSAATKPTADLSKLKRYHHNEHSLNVHEDPIGEFYSVRDVQSLLAIKPAAAPAVPEGYVLMPKRLTAENGAKAAMIGEFYEEITVRCPDCDDCDEGQYCAGCNDEGAVQQPVQVQWDTIKQIYSRAVELLAANPAASTPAAQAVSEQKLRDALRWALEWIDAVPVDATLPAMPGFDRDYVNDLLAAASTTGAAQTAEQVRDEFTITGNVCEMGRLDGENGEHGLVIKRETDFVTVKGLKISELQELSRVAFDDVEVSIRVARPVPTHSSEAGDA